MKLHSSPFSFIKSLLLISVFVLLLVNSSKGQTVNFNLITAPCNANGVLVIETTGITPPVTFQIYSGSINVSHTTNYVNDTIFNYTGEAIYVSLQQNGAVVAGGQYAGAPPFTFTSSVTTPVCPSLATATITVTGGAPPYTYQWTDVSNTSVGTSNPISLPNGAYGLLITDNAGCTFGTPADSNGIYFYNISNVTATTSSTTASCTNGTASVVAGGGTNPYTYQWSNGANSSSISGLTAGSYNVTVADAQGCLAYNSVYIQQIPQITVNTTPTPATCIQNDGSLIAFGSGGTPPYTYVWNTGQTTQTVSGIASGGYNVTATDANGCTGASQAYVPTSTPVNVTYSSTSSLCIAPTGTATISATGGTPPYSVVWNTFPVQTGVTITGLAPGNYSFTVTDAVGCIQSGAVNVPPVSNVFASITETNAMCLLSNGSATITAWSTNLPCTYIWNTGSTAPSIFNLPPGNYNCIVTDNMGCSVNKTTYVYSSSPINIGFSTTPASCIYTPDGIALANATGGTPPYTYNWSNGGNTASISGLGYGQYWVSVHDATGCVQNAYVYVGYNAAATNCYCTISGTVYDDVNANCTMDLGETGIENIMIHCSSFGYTFTDANGHYSFKVPTGNYIVSENVQAYYPLAACQSNAVTANVIAASGCVNTVNFGNVINPIHDISMYTTWGNHPVPGNMYNQNVVIHNSGTVNESTIVMGYKHDGQLTYSSVSPNLFTQLNSVTAPDWYSVVSGSFPYLSPGQNQVLNLSYNVPTNIPINTNVVFKDSVVYQSPMTNWLNDYSPWDNVNYYNDQVVGSWDPNFKEVEPKGVGAPGYIHDDDSVLTYTIHFQNTGNYYAQNIYLLDTLDSDLNWATLHPVYADHPFTTSMTESGVVKFMFSNIQLAPEAWGFTGSTGYIIYTVHLKPHLAINTQIKNSASIYFDYNAGVRTNTTLNTINNTIGIKEPVASTMDLNLYPNPTSDNVTILITSESASTVKLEIINLLGERVKAQTIDLKSGKNIFTADVSNLIPGIYFVEVLNAGQKQVKKLSVLR